jgi:hypothetical protein
MGLIAPIEEIPQCVPDDRAPVSCSFEADVLETTCLVATQPKCDPS